MIIADTDVLIDYLRLIIPVAARVAVLIESGELCTTAISRYEIGSGIHTSRQIESARRLFALLPTLPLDERSAERGAAVNRDLARKGVSIGMADSLIAGIALTANWMLLTRNRRHFDRVEGLVLAPLT
jgi:tRNA(fMet)-specific endonuclease VapC